MVKTFILYNEIEVGEGPVDCIYLVKGECRAQPFARQRRTDSTGFYTPTEDEQKKFCVNPSEWTSCPRFQVYREHLRTIGLKK